jgi:hypothetical protein
MQHLLHVELPHVCLTIRPVRPPRLQIVDTRPHLEGRIVRPWVHDLKILRVKDVGRFALPRFLWSIRLQPRPHEEYIYSRFPTKMVDLRLPASWCVRLVPMCGPCLKQQVSMDY